jgi:hypothetical protein
METSANGYISRTDPFTFTPSPLARLGGF